MSTHRKLFGTDGVRGVANTEPMMPELALKLGKAVTLLDQQHIPLDATLGSLQHDGRVPPGPKYSVS